MSLMKQKELKKNRRPFRKDGFKSKHQAIN